MKRIHFFAFFLLGAFTACQKDPMETIAPTASETIIAPPPGIKLCSEYRSVANPTDVMRFKYDNMGRVVEQIEEDHIMFVSYPNLTTIRIVDSSIVDKKVVWDFTGHLNVSGQLVAGTGRETRVSSTPIPASYVFQYDLNGYMTQKTIDKNNGQSVFVHTYKYKNGNMIRHDIARNGMHQYSVTRDYGKLPDNLGWTYDQFLVPGSFAGKANKNLSIKCTVTYLNNPVADWFANITYSMDADNYPIKTQSDFSNGNTLVYEYIY